MSKCKSCAYFECQISALGEYLHPSHPYTDVYKGMYVCIFISPHRSLLSILPRALWGILYARTAAAKMSRVIGLLRGIQVWKYCCSSRTSRGNITRIMGPPAFGRAHTWLYSFLYTRPICWCYMHGLCASRHTALSIAHLVIMRVVSRIEVSGFLCPYKVTNLDAAKVKVAN